jgi:hypothetical protein
MYEPTILHQLAKLHGAIRAYQDLDSEIPDRRARLLQSAHELTGTKYRSLGRRYRTLKKGHHHEGRTPLTKVIQP